ncbi:MAG: aminotransferase class I/II-fold pyridoxal phosphate-dependent enzyme [Thaumarchaeota archaeon]|nr:aminotransferase class I/II-fold pyridoxal phosphate-dependent enzyme [Nitrososphaerota archaeon]
MNSGPSVKPRVLEGAQAHAAVVDGKDVIVLAANNYLGLTYHPKVIRAVKAAVDRYGTGTGCGRGLASMRLQLELEERIAKFKETEASLVFPTGYDTNLGAIWALAGKDSVLICDEFNHASVFDGAKLGRASLKVYGHGDMRSLERILRGLKNRKSVFVVTPGIFPLEGDIARLPEIVELAERYSATVYLDDAHAVGVLGQKGTGSVEHFGLQGRVEVQAGTLSKALASVGGYIAGSGDLRLYLSKKARPFSQSTGHLAPPSVAAVIACLDILEKDQSLLGQLWKNARYFREGLAGLGFDTGRSETPIIPVSMGSTSAAVEFSRGLFDEGIFAQPFFYPAVPEGEARLRTIVAATHTKPELDRALEAFDKVRRRLDVLN